MIQIILVMNKYRHPGPAVASICMKLLRGSTETINEVNTATPPKTPKIIHRFPFHVPHMQQHPPLIPPIKAPKPQVTYTPQSPSITIFIYHTTNMARLTILLALLATLLFATHASARKQQENSCQRELENVNLRHCERHIMQRVKRDEGKGQEGSEKEENVLYMKGIASHHNKNFFYRNRDYKRSCCNQLRELEESPACMCEALRQIMENQSEKLQSSKQMQRFAEQTWNLPQSCGLGSQRTECDISTQTQE